MKAEVSWSSPELLPWLSLILLWSGWVPLLEEVETSVNSLKIVLQPAIVSSALKSSEPQAPNSSPKSVSPAEKLQQLSPILLGSSHVLLQLLTPVKVEKSANFPELSLQSSLILPALKA